MFEEIKLENKYLKCGILPELGGKVRTLYYKPGQFELAAQPENHPYIKPWEHTPFEQADASGFDDAFPTIVACEVYYGNRNIEYTDHGEIWRSSFHVVNKTDNLAELEFRSTQYEYVYKKKIELVQNKVHWSYQIENIGKKDFPCLWTMHGLVKYEENMHFLYPQGVESFISAYETKELGVLGKRHSIASANYDFTKVPKKNSLSCQKYYVDGKVQQGYCGYEYPSSRMRCELIYDKEKLPYLGVWVTAGGFRGDYNCALEPSNGYFDSVDIAQKNGACPILHSGEKMEFDMELVFNQS